MATYAHYCLHKFHKWPSEFDALPEEEKALVIASIDVKIKAEKEKEEELKRKTKK